jgi:hypothetical protein
MKKLLVIVLAASALLLVATLAAPQAKAATWHTVKAAADHHNRGFDVRLYPARPPRLKYWTAREWDADDDGGEWEYDWVRFRLIRNDTSSVVKQVGPLYSPTGYKNWHAVGISLPSGVRQYTLKVASDDARWGFRLQQKY